MKYTTFLAALLFILAGCSRISWLNWNHDNPSATSADARPAAEKEPAKSLYDRLGGETGIRALVDDFVPRAAADEKVNFTRKGTGHEWQATPQNVAQFKERMVQFLGVATGGPQKYQGQDLGTAHKGMKITDREFDALADDLKQSLAKLSVPPREQKELLDIVASTRGVIVEKP